MKNKFLLSVLLILFVASPNFLFGQCTVSVDGDTNITCGESVTLTGYGYIMSATYSDDFNSGINALLWGSAGISTGGTTTPAGAPCAAGNPAGGGAVPGGNSLWFTQGAAVPRYARTIQIPIPAAGGNIYFDFKFAATNGSPPCDGPDNQGENVHMEFSTNNGVTWTDVPALTFPFNHNINPTPWNGIAFFDPSSSVYQSFEDTWLSCQVPIPAAAYGQNTRFRWIQNAPTSSNWDQWGLDNVNFDFTTGSNYTWTNSLGTVVSTNQTFTPSPNITTTETFTLTYSNSVSSCTTSHTINVSPLIVTPAILTSTACPSTEDLTADPSFGNCTYKIYLYDNGGDGWVNTNPLNPNNRLEVLVDGVLISTITMISGYGPTVYSFTVTNGGTLATTFLGGGPNPQECAYFIEDNQGNLVCFDGINMASPPWPFPVFSGSPVFNATPASGCNLTTTCIPTNTYSYSWTTSPGGSITGISSPVSQNTSVTVQMINQDYSICVTDIANPGCVACDTITVNGNAGIGTFDFAITSANPICNDGSVTTVNFEISSTTISVGSFTFDIIDNSGTIINPTPIPFNTIPFTGTITLPQPLIAGSYDYGITNVLDANGCPVAVNQPNPITFVINDPPNAGVDASITVCETSTPFDLFTILTGNPDLGGVWTNSSNIQVGSFYIPSTTSSDIFTYTLTGASPCANDFSTVTVTNNSLPDAGTNGMHTVCQNDPAFNMENFLGGTPQPGGSWTDASGNNLGSNMFDPSTMSSGVFTYTVVGTSPCPSGSANLTVTVDPLPTAIISTNTATICNGNNATLDFTFTGTAPFDVTFNDGTNPNVTQTINATTGTATVSPSSPTTTYTLVSVLDANGCTSTLSGSVTITVTPGPDAGTAGSRVTCENSSAFDLFNELGGTPDVSGTWSEPSVGTTSNMFNPSAFGAGTFTLTYTVTSPPCIPATADVTVTVSPLVDAGGDGNITVCENDPNFNLFDELTGSPNPGGIWTLGGIPVPNTFNPSTSGIGTFVYTYTVLGASPCPDDQATVTVIVNPQPVVTISGTTTITQGQSTPITFNLTIGTPPFTVIYDDGTSTITSPSLNSTTGTINVSPNASTTYTLVSVTDANGCIASLSGSAIITVNQLPTVTITGDATICSGQNSPIDFILGGNPPFTVDYTVNGAAAFSVFNSVGSNVLNMSPFVTTTYTLVSITDGNGVVDNAVSGSVTITVNPLPTAIISGDNTICDGMQTPLNFTLTGASDYSLTYNPGGVVVTLNASGNDATTGNPIMVSPTSTTSYSIVSLTDANNCTNAGSGSANITVNPLPDMQISATSTTLCAGQSAALGFTPTGTAPFNLNYTVNGTSTNVTLDAAGTISGTPVAVTPASTTTYTLVDVTDANGCLNSLLNSSITINVNPLPTATISGSTSICTGQSTDLGFTFTGTAPYTINYDIGITTTSDVLNNNVDVITVSPTSTTTYTLVDVTDAFCTNAASGIVIVTVNPLPDATISGGATLCADGNTAQIDIIANGTAPFNVIYSDGFNNIPLSGITSPYNFQTNTAGTYTLSSITDVNGCSGTVAGAANVVVNPLPVASFSFMPQPADINNPTIYFTDMSSGLITGMYDFGDGTTLPSVLGGQLSHTYLDTGSYQVLYTATSTDGCTATVGHTIIIDPAFLIYIPTGFTPNRDAKNDVFIPIMMGVDEYNFYIYDRFGELIFETENQLEGWNGRVHGNEFALAGHYAYAVKIVDMLGKKRDFTGTLTLIR